MLAPGGRLCVVTFHSLEDRIVKEFFKLKSGDVPRSSRHMPTCETNISEPTFKMVFRGGKKATESEITINTRSRSAKMRAAVRTLAPSWLGEKKYD